MAGTLAPFWDSQFFDNNGDPLALGTIDVYAAGTTTRIDTYSASSLAGGTENANPIVLDSSGYPSSASVPVSIFLSATSYKFVLKNAAGVVQRTVDNVSAYAAFNVNIDVQGVAGETLSAGDGVYLSDGSGALTAGRWYKWDADNSYSSSDATVIGMVVSDIALAATGSIRIGGDAAKTGLSAGTDYFISATAGALTSTAPANRRLVGRADTNTTITLAPGPRYSELTPIDNSIMDGRLTLTTAVPVTTADVTGATSVFFTPYKGNRIALFDGTNWNVRTFTELTIALGTLSSGRPYDIFAYDNAGVVAIDTLVAWTNDTTRATALALQNGVLSKTGALTRRYLGTFYTSSTTQTEDSMAKRWLWNYYNRVITPARVLEATNSWPYATATLRQANGAAGNQIDVVNGVAEEAIDVTVNAVMTNDTNATGGGAVAIGEDSTSALITGSLTGWGINPVTNNSQYMALTARLTKVPAAGRHYYVWLEIGTAAGVQTWYGDNGTPTTFQCGITALWKR